MADRFLKHIPSGQVFIYAPPWIDQDDFVEVATATGDPFPPDAPVVNPTPKGKRLTKPATVVEVPLPVVVDDAALSADASQGLAAQGL
jgi:hypothetical protein